MKASILFALDSYRPNIDGVAISVERQARGLARRGYEVAIVAPGQRFADYEESIAGVRVFRVKSLPVGGRHWRVTALAGSSVERIFDEFRPDVAVVSLPFLLNRAVLGEAEKRQIPTVGIVGTMPEWLFYNLGFLKPLTELLYDRIWRTMIVDFYDRCDRVIGPTRTTLSYLREHGLQQPATVVSNGVELDRFYPRPRDAELAQRLGVPDKPTVLYTGRLDAEKCMEVWVKAMPLVLEQVDAHFIIGGSGSEREKIEEMVRTLGVADHTTFPGFLEDDEYPRLYSLANVFAIASPAELQSIVTLEAAASGLPLVGVNAGALPELIVEGRNGHLFPRDDSEALAAGVIDVLANGRNARRMGIESRAIAYEHDIEASLDALAELHSEVIEVRARAA